MNYSVTGYNPHINYGNYPLNNSVVARNVAFTGQPDTVSLSSDNQTQDNKAGLSKNAKLGLVALALVGIGAAVYILSRGRVGNKSVQKLAEHIEFQPAKTIEEARAFAKDKLGVQYLYEDKTNLDMINTVNEWLHKEKLIRQNKIVDFIYFTEKDLENPLAITDKVLINGKECNALHVNTAYINRFDEVLDNAFKPHGDINLSQLIRKNAKNQYEVTKPEYNCENLNKLIQKLNNYSEKSSYKERMEIYDGISEVIPYWRKISTGNKAVMPDFLHDGMFLHEQGHLLHQNSELYAKLGDTTSAMSKEFQQPNIKNIANKVSDYACNSPLEFVAEVYKRHCKGVKFDKDILDLYVKYDGPVLS